MSNEYQAVSELPEVEASGASCRALAPVAGSALPRVLVVEDDSAVADGIRMLLERMYEVVVAVGGAAALELLESSPPFGAILCDVMMPGVSGMDLYRQLRSTDPRQAERIIFMTGGAYTDEADEFLAAVDNIQVQKPFNLQRLYQQLRSVISAGEQ